MPTVNIGILEAVLRLQDQMTPALQLAGQRMKEVGAKMTRVGTQMRTVGTGMTAAITLPIAAIGTAAVKAALDFESSFAGVRKTVDATESEFAALEQGFRDLAKEIPVSVNELNRIGEAAGQLGIETENILGFTRVMADLGATTNLSANEAASALARLANITQLPQTDFDRLGSTIVALGNNLATTESEIVNFGLRIAGAGSQVGLSEAQILAFAGALSSVGISAEAGGTATSRVFVEIANSVASGGEKLGQFAAIAGVSVDDFARSFQEDAAGATTTFIEGLGRLSDQGVNVFGVLEDVGFANVRVRDALLRASGAGDLLREALSLGSQAWEENTALAIEAQQRYDTMASKLTILWNIVRDVAVTFGTALLPTIEQLTDFLRTRALPVVERLATWFAELPQPVRTAAIVIAGLAAAAGPLLVVFGLMATSIGALLPLFVTAVGAIGSFTLTTTAAGATAVTVTPLLVALKAAILTFGPALLVVAAAWAAWKFDLFGVRDAVTEVRATMERLALKMQGLSDAQIDAFLANKAMADGLRGTITVADQLAAQIGQIGLAADMQQLELIFDNFNRTGRITTKSMRLIADKALELKAGGEALSPVMRTLIDQLSSMAQAAVEVALAEKGTIDRTAKFTEALQDLGFIGLDGVNKKLAQLAELQQAAAAMGVPAVAIAQALKAEYDALAEAAARSGVEAAALNEAITANAVAGLQAIPVTQLSTHLWGLARHEIVGLTDEQNAAATQARLTAEAFERTGIATQASLMAARVQAETDYQLIADAAGQGSTQAQAAFQLLREKHDAEMGTLPGFWDTTVIPGIAQTFTTLDTAIQGTFAQMIIGAKGFKEGFLEIWGSIKSGFSNILNQMLGSFGDTFLGGLLSKLTGSGGKIGEALGGLFGGGKGGGGIGGILGKIFGGGGGGGVGGILGKIGKVATGGATAAVGGVLSSTALGTLASGGTATAAAGGGGLFAGLGGALTTGLATAGIGAAIFGGFKLFQKLLGGSAQDQLVDQITETVRSVRNAGGVAALGLFPVLGHVNQAYDAIEQLNNSVAGHGAINPLISDIQQAAGSFSKEELAAWNDVLARRTHLLNTISPEQAMRAARLARIRDQFGSDVNIVAGAVPEEELGPLGARHGLIGDFGTGTPVMLHGREAIVPLDGPARMGPITQLENAMRALTTALARHVPGGGRDGDTYILVADGKARLLGRAEFRQIAAAFQGAQIRVPSRGVGDRIG